MKCTRACGREADVSYSDLCEICRYRRLAQVTAESPGKIKAEINVVLRDDQCQVVITGDESGRISLEVRPGGMCLSPATARRVADVLRRVADTVIVPEASP